MSDSGWKELEKQTQSFELPGECHCRLICIRSVKNRSLAEFSETIPDCKKNFGQHYLPLQYVVVGNAIETEKCDQARHVETGNISNYLQLTKQSLGFQCIMISDIFWPGI